MTVNPLLQLKTQGQSVWLDNLTRSMVAGGGLRRLVEKDGVSGVTSNPAIFQKAISGSEAYDDQIRRLVQAGAEPIAVYEALAIQDIQGACDVLRPVYDAANGTDGFVSLEVSPHLARDTRGTVEEALRLWDSVGRENLMIKIPGTAEGVPAVEEVLSRGVNVNVTLLFALDAYRAVMEAHQRAMERRLNSGDAVAGVASVASFFLSRIDTKVDAALDALAKAGEHAEEAKALRGRAAVASARLAYRMWSRLYSGERWERLREAGARVQKPLWASTSTKDPSFPDVKYVEPLIGPDTVNTMPDETLEAFRDHGRVARTVDRDVEDEARVMTRLAAIGVDMTAVTDALVEEGIRKFVEPFDKLVGSLREKAAQLSSR